MTDDQREDIEIALNECKNQILTKLHGDGYLREGIEQRDLERLLNTWIITYAPPTTFLAKGQGPKLGNKANEPRVIVAICDDLTTKS